MGDLTNGTLVRHASLGVGKIVALEPDAVHVFFPSSDNRFATKLRLPTARPFLSIDGVPPDPWLSGLTAFAFDDETRRYALGTSWLTQDEATAQFVAAYPRGFADARYLSAADAGARAPRWRTAHEGWVKALGNGQARRLVEKGDVRELVKRAVSLERQVAPLGPPSDATVLADALGDGPETRTFFERLVELLSVPSPTRARFDRLFAAAMDLTGGAESAWVLATLLPFVAEPGRHFVVRPGVARAAASRLGCDIRWNDTPNWTTYAALRALCTKLLGELRGLGAEDLVDVEAFLHLVATTRPRKAAASSGSRVRRAQPARSGAAVRERRPTTSRSPRRAR